MHILLISHLIHFQQACCNSHTLLLLLLYIAKHWYYDHLIYLHYSIDLEISVF